MYLSLAVAQAVIMLECTPAAGEHREDEEGGEVKKKERVGQSHQQTFTQVTDQRWSSLDLSRPMPITAIQAVFSPSLLSPAGLHCEHTHTRKSRHREIEVARYHSLDYMR